ncbi:MAG: hypothetical protein ACTS9Y_07935 [Methylophilus sp.]|uniref:hypothetical protein n=1 Tax=Methylophilus sp. TaxID=29541 RepID=UPI003F9F2821
MLDKNRSEITWIEPISLDGCDGETTSRKTAVREERLQNREGKSCSRTVKQALAIDHLKVRKAG